MKVRFGWLTKTLSWEQIRTRPPMPNASVKAYTSAYQNKKQILNVVAMAIQAGMLGGEGAMDFAQATKVAGMDTGPPTLERSMSSEVCAFGSEGI